MNREAVAAELPPDTVAWLEHASPRLWGAVAREVALRVATTLLFNQGEAGLTRKVYELLCGDPSPAVRALAQSAVFPEPKPWLAKPIAREVARWFQVAEWAVYEDLRYEQMRRRFARQQGEEENTPL